MTSKSVSKSEEMTLRGYYDNLPESTFPKKDLISKIMLQCDVSFTTAHNWVKGKTRPQKESYVEKLSEITKIPKEQLWQ